MSYGGYGGGGYGQGSASTIIRYVTSFVVAGISFLIPIDNYAIKSIIFLVVGMGIQYLWKLIAGLF